MKTSELSGKALAWAVAHANEQSHLLTHWLGRMYINDATPYSPESDWAQGGPIIELERINLYRNSCEWDADIIWMNDDDSEMHEVEMTASTPLIAAMRCYVASKLGDEVEIPEELK